VEEEIAGYQGDGGGRGGRSCRRRSRHSERASEQGASERRTSVSTAVV